MQVIVPALRYFVLSKICMIYVRSLNGAHHGRLGIFDQAEPYPANNKCFRYSEKIQLDTNIPLSNERRCQLDDWLTDSLNEAYRSRQHNVLKPNQELTEISSAQYGELESLRKQLLCKDAECKLFKSLAEAREDSLDNLGHLVHDLQRKRHRPKESLLKKIEDLTVKLRLTTGQRDQAIQALSCSAKGNDSCEGVLDADTINQPCSAKTTCALSKSTEGVRATFNFLWR